MGKMNAKEAALKWGISLRRVQEHCRTGRIIGAERLGKVWMIPVDAHRPEDRRMSHHKEQDISHQPLIRKSPFLDMTDLYSVPGSAEQCIEKLSDYPESQALFAAEIAYSRGEIDKVVAHAENFLNSYSGFYAVTGAGMLLALAAMWKGDVALWKQARMHLFEAPWKTEDQRDQIALSLACVDSAIRSLQAYPEWFIRGKFEHLPFSSFPAAKVFYIKYLLVFAQELASEKFSLPDVTGMGLMKTLPYIIEPMISQAMADKTVIPEIYLRLLCAIAYHQYGDDRSASEHLDKAIDLVLPDRLFGILAEHRRQLDYLLDERLEYKDKEAYMKYKELHQQLLSGWTKIHNAVLERTVSMHLSIREREIARLAAFGLSNQEITERLHISLSAVKKALYDAMNKTGANRRTELKYYI